MKLLKKNIINSRGQAILELALVLPIIILLLMGTIELGRVYSAYVIISNAARDGARYGAIGYDDDSISAKIYDYTSSLNSDSLHIEITPQYSNRERGEEITVLITYSIDIISPVISSIVPNPLDVNSSTTMRVE